jgi:hypothetical protein
LANLAKQFQRDVDPGRLHQFAMSLGLSVDSPLSLGIGWSARHRAWAFPMHSATGDVVGIRLRRPNGFKFAVKGGHEGVFLVNRGARQDGARLLIAEGPTDTAALLDMGFDCVVGRPSCTGGIKALVALVALRERPDVVIFGDGDEPGRRGAGSLATVLLPHAPTVRVVFPPDGIKDVREWLKSGGRFVDVEEAIDAALPRSLAIRTRKVAYGR